MAAEVRQPEGSYNFGGWYDTSTAPDVVTDVNGNPAVLSGQLLQIRMRRYSAGGQI